MLTSKRFSVLLEVEDIQRIEEEIQAEEAELTTALQATRVEQGSIEQTDERIRDGAEQQLNVITSSQVSTWHLLARNPFGHSAVWTNVMDYMRWEHMVSSMPTISLFEIVCKWCFKPKFSIVPPNEHLFFL